MNAEKEYQNQATLAGGKELTEKECQNQVTLAGGKELTDNDLESIVGGGSIGTFDRYGNIIPGSSDNIYQYANPLASKKH